MSSIIQIIRGDTAKYKFQRLDGDGQVITTLPDSLYFTVKESANKLNYVFQKTLDDMTVDSDGTYHFIVEPEDTNGLQYGSYAYDIEVIIDGVKTTVAFGTFTILPEVTWVQNEEES
jgi:hypothetical protein